DDMTQEVFAAVAQSLDRFHRDRPGDTFRGWLKGITRNKLLEYHRRKRDAPAVGGTEAHLRMQDVPDVELEMADDVPSEKSALYHRALELVRAEFEPSTWEMFWKTTVDGRPAVDVARDLAVTPAAVRVAKFRVLRRLREEIGDLID